MIEAAICASQRRELERYPARGHTPLHRRLSPGSAGLISQRAALNDPTAAPF
jgi:hypothetical protein